MFLRGLFLLSSLCILGSSVNAQCPSNPLQHNYTADLVLAAGWSSSLVSNDLNFPRGMLFDLEGNLLVVDKGIGVVGWKVVEREDGGACLVEKKVIVENDQFNHGIALSEDGKTLYASTKNDVFFYSYDAKTRTTTSSSKSLITNMSNNGHVTRTLYIHSGTILISAGSEGNLDPLATNPNSGHSMIKFFPLKEAHALTNPFDFKKEGRVLGWGLRNSVGLTVDPTTGGVWAVENSVDAFTRGGKSVSEVSEDNPGEELNFLGWWNKTVDNSEYMGPNYGYPSCVTVWDVPSLPDNGGIITGQQIPVDQLNTTATDADCKDEKKFVPPRLAFQAHMAPLDLRFDYFPSGGDGGLWVSFHGSWNRTIPTGYKLSKIPFNKASGQPVAKATDKQNYEDVFWNRDTMKCKRGECFRPVGVAIDGKGRVWIGSDTTKEVMVLWTKGDRKGGPEGTTNVNNEKDGKTGKSSAVVGRSLSRKVGVAGLVAVVMGMMLL